MMYERKSPIQLLAERLGCWDEVAHLTDIQAIRTLQRKEGNTDCYGRDKPLVSTTSYGDDIYCGVSDCTWRLDCNRFRIPNQIASGRGTATQEDILLQADRFDCRDEARRLTEVEAVRLIQRRGGYTPCYAGELPLYPFQDGSLVCGNFKCFWKQPCDGFRHPQVIPLAKALNSADLDTLTSLREKIGELRARLENPASRSVGMQLGSFNQLYPATKKMLLASPHTVVGEQPDLDELRPYLLQDRSRNISGSSGGYSFLYEIDLFLTQDLPRLQIWLSEVKPFLDTGSLDYFPLIHTVSGSKQVSRGGIYSQGSIPSYWAEDRDLKLDTFEAPHLGVPSGEIMLTRAEFAPILNLDLPVLENIDMGRLFQLLSDHPEELLSFRDFLMDKVDEMSAAAVGSEQFGRDVARLERELRDRLRRLETDYKSARLKAAFALGGLAVASWTLAIYCILRGESDLLTILGPGGAAVTAGASYSEYLIERLKLKKEPVYFLWEIGKSERKK